MQPCAQCAMFPSWYPSGGTPRARRSSIQRFSPRAVYRASEGTFSGSGVFLVGFVLGTSNPHHFTAQPFRHCLRLVVNRAPDAFSLADDAHPVPSDHDEVAGQEFVSPLVDVFLRLEHWSRYRVGRPNSECCHKIIIIYGDHVSPTKLSGGRS